MHDINRDQSSVEMNKRSDQDRCRQTAKVIMSGVLHQKSFGSIPFLGTISSLIVFVGQLILHVHGFSYVVCIRTANSVSIIQAGVCWWSS